MYLTHGRTNREAKEESLNELAQQIHMRTNEIQKMWRSLRVQYNTCKKNGNTTWKFYEHFSFLSSEINVQFGETHAREGVESSVTQPEDIFDSMALLDDVHSYSPNEISADELDISRPISVSSADGDHVQSSSSQQSRYEQSDSSSQ